MFILILLCYSVTLIQFCNAYVNQETRYECGAHGKFEYCIDGIPGCVIGCHCHPGYYFDTDTKICEPNVKLTQGYRRRYLSEPTRVYVQPMFTPTATEPLPMPITTDRLEEKVDEMTKDTDELGDWLYNQFFKTIENQVINNTNTDKKGKEKDKKILTRRSGGDDDDGDEVFNKSKRKPRKSMRSGKKKKHNKVHGLRRKLLRITEDDSLFESDSDSDSSGSSSGSDSDSSSDSDKSSDSTSGSDGKSEKKGEDKDHGHKKVIIFNRRPKPPLPSFIFLPSMDTPFYPPIGLPAPPPMPMYPFVPVPPMPPPFPYGPPPNCDEGENNATTTTTATPGSTDTTEQTETTEESTDSTTEATTPEIKTDTRSRLEKLKSKKSEKFLARANESGKHQKNKNSQRNKLMQKLREKMKESKKKAEQEEAPNESQEGEAPLADDFPVSQETFTSQVRRQKKTRDKVPKLDDVDFKYLSELIHRVNQSEDRNKQPAPPVQSNGDLQKIEQPPSPSRRYNTYSEPARIQPVYNPPRNLQNNVRLDDVYYTNLGRQIASMIRNADSKIDHQVINDPGQLQYHSVLNQQKNMPRNYWERSVRSPLPQMGKSMDYLDESRTFLKQSNEKKLLTLENEVETFASTSKPLSLQDLENILNTMQRAHVHITFDDHSQSTKQTSNASLNVNLLPRYVKTDPYRRLFKSPEYIEYTPTSKAYIEVPKNVTNMEQNEIIVQKPLPQEQKKKDDIIFGDYWMYENPRQPMTIPTVVNASAAQDKQRLTKSQDNTQSSKKKFVANMHPVHSVMPQVALQPPRDKKPNLGYLQFLRNVPIIKHNPQKRPEQNLVSRPQTGVVNYKTLKYFTGNKHHYMFEAASYPLQLASFRRQISKPLGKMSPSYFHHELHHFDYFD